MNRVTAFLDRKRHMDLPVLVQEMRVRQRGVRPFIVTFAYAVALAAIAIAYTCSLSESVSSDPYEISLWGRRLFAFLTMAQLAMISLIVPAYSSVVVTTEREKGTFELLVLTMLSSGGIVRQKLTAAIAEILMLALTSAPVLALVFLFGGVSPLQLAVAFCLFVMTALLLGSFGVLCSCMFANSRTATSVAYLGMFGFLLLMPLGAEWFRDVTYTGLAGSVDAFPFVLIGLLFLIGGLTALALFSLVTHLLKRKTRQWTVRAFRMAMFGACYAVVLMVLTIPALSNLAIEVLFGVDRDVSLPMLVNPFVAVESLVEEGGMSNLSPLIVTSTIVFAVLCSCLFVSLSVRRFGVLRRS